MGDKVNAAAAFKTAYELARKDNKENLQSISFDYAQSLYDLGDYAGADDIYKKMLAVDEADQAAMVGLARNMQKQGRYQASLELLAKCRKFNADYGEIDHFEMLAYDKTGEAKKAVDAALDWIKHTDDTDFEAIMKVLKKQPVYAEAALKSRAKISEEKLQYEFLLSALYTCTHQYAKAARAYDRLVEEYGYAEEFYIARAESYRALGMYDRAISIVSKAMESGSNRELLEYRGDYYRLSGDLDAAIADFSLAIEEDPVSAFPHYRRGWCYEMKGDKEKAMADYNQGIELDDTYYYLFLMRGELYQFSGEEEKAKADFNRVLQLDTLVDGNSCRHYALHFLGRDQEAEVWMDKIIALDPEEAGNYYDQACLYSRMGRLEDAVKALKTAFEKGYRSFAHIEHDYDLDAIRELPSFKALIEEYKAKHEAYLKENAIDVPSTEESITEVAIKRQPGGTFEIPCNINGLALQMIFDTGASDVTISSVEANFMLKNGYLSEKDIKGKKYYQIANGLLSEGTVITLHEVKIGDAVLRNVDASVVKNQQAPLLLGQSVMERFGTITIDNQNNKLIIKH